MNIFTIFKRFYKQIMIANIMKHIGHFLIVLFALFYISSFFGN